MEIAFEKYRRLEAYLFTEVHANFVQDSQLSVQDFFCIVIWKANRAKSKIADKILKQHTDLASGVNSITQRLSELNAPKAQMQFLWETSGFRLPMASAILTVLFPADFTVYDYRVCEEIGADKSLASRTNFDNLWVGYLDYKAKVIAAAPEGFSLRKADQYLWGRSFCRQLEEDIEKSFGLGSSNYT